MGTSRHTLLNNDPDLRSFSLCQFLSITERYLTLRMKACAPPTTQCVAWTDCWSDWLAVGTAAAVVPSTLVDDSKPL